MKEVAPKRETCLPPDYMKSIKILAFAILTACALETAQAQTTVTLTAFDSKTISDANNTNWNDNRYRAYWNNSTQGFVDGFAKFDLSSIPDTATITGMVLTTYHEFGFGNPFMDPEVRVYRSAGDSWSRGANDTHPGLNEALTPVTTGFPGADLVPVVWNLDVNAVSWSGDLADDTLTLALRNEAGAVSRYSYVYFYGSDSSPAPPELEVTYTDGFTLSATGSCPGSMTFSVSGETPGGSIAFIYGTPGSFTWGGTPCTGTTVNINAPTIAQNSTATSITGTVPQGACGVIRVQAVDVATCTVSNFIDL